VVRLTGQENTRDRRGEKTEQSAYLPWNSGSSSLCIFETPSMKSSEPIR
jgi:hypothetical protein